MARKILYNHKKIEPKWQKKWEKEKIYKAVDFSKKPKSYILVEFPYPSGQGLHVGHCRSYTAMDIIARKKRMQGYNVLFPMGWDAFGLPTENYAIKTGTSPRVVTKKNTDNFRKQEKALGLSFDWGREVNTTEPSYYKWTQWIFLKLFENGLAYKKKMPVNWCPSCKIGLANEEVIDGKCERCGTEVEKREKEQWMLKITEYADRLIDDLDLVNYPEKVKILEKDWIGKSVGYRVSFPLSGGHGKIEVFTTRIDTIFGATYLVISPEHKIIASLGEKIENINEVKEYIEKAKTKSERKRLADAKEKSGVKVKGIKAINPANGKEIPLFVADYVLAEYGTGAIMAVPAHDERDFDFASKYNLPIIKVVESQGKEGGDIGGDAGKKAYSGDGILVNSGEFSGLASGVAKEKIGEWLRSKKMAKKEVNYKLRDWLFSRQRYWGEPIPLVFCQHCKEEIEKLKREGKESELKKKFSPGEILNPGWIPLKENKLPLELPRVKNYKPTEEGDSPLAANKKWVSAKCPRCGHKARRETDVMPNWAGSNWYYLRYCDPKNNKELASKEKIKYWMPVDWYNGGMEHTTLHLLYSRFIYKFLWDIGAVPKELGPEPYKKRTSHGMILGEGGIKMSKSKGNVINPDDVIKKEGADALRVYEMFMGPFSQEIAWDENGLKGAKKFLVKVFTLVNQWAKKKTGKETTIEMAKLLHKTIQKVTSDIDNLKFNTAVSAMMEFANFWQNNIFSISKEDLASFLKVFSVFAPHLGEELWQKIGGKKSVFLSAWPSYDESLTEEKNVKIVIQINGKVRAEIVRKKGIDKKEAEEAALSIEKIRKTIGDKKIKKVIYVNDKLINFVV